MIVRTCRSKHFFCMTIIALCITAAYSPLAASQETKKEAALSCSSSEVPFPCLPAEARKEIPEAPGQQAASLPDAPQAQDQNNSSIPPSHPQHDKMALLLLPAAPNSHAWS